MSVELTREGRLSMSMSHSEREIVPDGWTSESKANSIKLASNYSSIKRIQDKLILASNGHKISWFNCFLLYCCT